MKTIGGIVAAVGMLFAIQALASAVMTGRLREKEGWADLTAVVAVGIIVFAMGIAMFLRKPKTK